MTTGNAGAISAYSATAARWQRGPARIYDRLAAVLVGCSPVDLPGAVVADVGAGTGAASRAAYDAGARLVVALDPAVGMLRAIEGRRPLSLSADARALPLASATVDVGVAAFSFNHLDDPLSAMVEMTRVVRPGGAMLAGSYAADDRHEAKQVVEDTLRTAGWRPPDWYLWLRARAIPQMADGDQVGRLAERAGCTDVAVAHLRVPFPELTAADLVAWRLGMAQHAPFVAQLSATERGRITDACVASLEGAPDLVRSVLVLVARSPEQAVDPASQ